jgi:hypothetical protein
MTRQEAINLIKLRLGSRDDSDLDELVVAELGMAQTALEGTAPYPWFCLSENATASTVAEEARVPVPSDFVIEVDEMALEVLDPAESKYVDLVKVDYDVLLSKYGDAGPGLPAVYALVGDYFIFGPTPDDVYTLRMKYQGRDTNFTALAAGETNKWLTQFPDYLIPMAGVEVATWIKDAEAVKAFSDRLMLARARYAQLCTAREEANRTRYMEG